VKRHAASAWHLEKRRRRFVATNVKLHAASAWHLEKRRAAL